MEHPDASTVNRAPIGALKSEEDLLRFAQHLKALHLRLAERDRYHEALRAGLLRQIRVCEEYCVELAGAGGPRCAEMWAEVKKELAPFRAHVQG
jgi:hypothetical protein